MNENEWIKNCFISGRENGLPWCHYDKDGRFIPTLDGYAIIPREEYEELKGIYNQDNWRDRCEDGIKKGILWDIPDSFLDDRGLGNCIVVWRLGVKSFILENSSCRHFLSVPQNQNGTWCFDYGQGQPPGEVQVRWNEELKYWEFGGFHGNKWGGERKD